MQRSLHSRTALLCAAGLPRLVAVSVRRLFFPADKTHKSAVLMCRLCGNKRADLVCSVCLVLGRSTTWSALLMPRSRHSRTALLCAADAQEPVPRYYGISSGENYLRGIRRHTPGYRPFGPVPRCHFVSMVKHADQSPARSFQTGCLYLCV